MTKQPCPACGYVHASWDAQSTGRFNAAATRFVAANAGTPERATRIEAERDECQWRQRRRPSSRGRMDRQPSSKGTVQNHADSPASATRVRTLPGGPRLSDPPVFPAARMELLARERAWTELLKQLAFTLTVWDLDSDVRAQLEHPSEWARRMSVELAGMVSQ